MPRFCNQCRYLDGAACGCRMYRVSCSEPARSATCRLGRQPSQPALRRPAIATHPHAEVLTRLYIAAHCAAGVMTFGARLSRSTAAFEPQHNVESAASAQGAECHPCSTLQFGWGKPPSLLDPDALYRSIYRSPVLGRVAFFTQAFASAAQPPPHRGT
jgi:hypothetical protein